MNNEYIIINKTALEKRIEELESEQRGVVKQLKGLYNNLKGSSKYFDYKNDISKYFTSLTNEKRLLNKMLSQSTLLIPEISKAYDAGKLDKELSLSFDNPKGRYLNNLKLKL